MGYIYGHMSDPPPFPPAEKKLKFFHFPPCISTRGMISYAASTGNKGVSPRHAETRRVMAERYIIDNRTNRKQRQLARVI